MSQANGGVIFSIQGNTDILPYFLSLFLPCSVYDVVNISSTCPRQSALWCLSQHHLGSAGGEEKRVVFPVFGSLDPLLLASQVPSWVSFLLGERPSEPPVWGRSAGAPSSGGVLTSPSFLKRVSPGCVALG